MSTRYMQRKVFIVAIVVVISTFFAWQFMLAEEGEEKIPEKKYDLKDIEEVFKEIKTISLTTHADPLVRVSHGEDFTTHFAWKVYFRVPNCLRVETVIDMDPAGERKEYRTLVTQADSIIWREKYKLRTGGKKTPGKIHIIKYLLDDVKKIDFDLALKLREEDAASILLSVPQILLEWLPACYDLTLEEGKTDDGTEVHIFRGTPKEELPEVFEKSEIKTLGFGKSTVAFYVLKETKLPLKIEVFQEGITYTLSYVNIKVNEPIADTFFSYTPPEGARIIEQDLRISNAKLSESKKSSYTFIKGEMMRKYSIDFQKVWQASISAMEELEVKLVVNSPDQGLIKGENTDGTLIKITLESISPGITSVKVRVGLFGDKLISEKIHSTIEKHLSKIGDKKEDTTKEIK